MISEVVMPQMGADMTEGTIVRWLKHEGDEVTRGEIIAEIETDKANVEIEAFDAGVFRKAIAGEGDVVPVGEVIAIVAAPDDDISRYVNGASAKTSPSSAPGPSSPAPTAPTPSERQAPQSTPHEERAPTPPAPDIRPGGDGTATETAMSPGERLRVSPVARRIADERGIDLRQVRGTGPDGRIVKHDVEALQPSGAKAATPPAAARPQRGPTSPAPGPVAMSKMRQAIARRMSQSKREAPHYYLLVDIDMTDAMAFRKQANAALAEGEHISVNDIVVRACALGLQRHPMFNATMDGEQPVQHDSQNVCVAIALDEGLIAPAILDVGGKTVAQIARAAKDLISRAKGGALRPDEITAGTFTITNLGAFGIETLIGIIQPPQTAILGVGSVMKQPAVHDGAIVAREVMKVALSADHRVTDGAQGAQFLGEIKRLLETPLLLVL